MLKCSAKVLKEEIEQDIKHNIPYWEVMKGKGRKQ